MNEKFTKSTPEKDEHQKKIEKSKRLKEQLMKMDKNSIEFVDEKIRAIQAMGLKIQPIKDDDDEE